MENTATAHSAQAKIEPTVTLEWLELVTANITDDAQERSLLDLDGALAKLAQHITHTSIRPQPWLALGASLAAIGALAGRRYRTETNLRSNVMVLSLAPSGAGKEHPRQIIKQVFGAAGLNSYLGGERIASGAGMIAALVRHPVQLFQIDEFGKFAQVLTGQRAAPHLAEIWRNLTEFATSAGSTWLGAEYANQKEHPRTTIAQPCVALHATSTDSFWEALGNGHRHDGSLARFLLFESHRYPEVQHAPADRDNPPAGLLETLQEIAAPPAGAGALEAVMCPSTNPTPQTVPMDADARELWIDLNHDTTTRLRAAQRDQGTGDGEDAATIARWAEHVLRLALISAVSADPLEPVITAPRFEWASDVGFQCIERMLCQAERYSADNDEERAKKRIFELICRAGKDGIALNQITRATRNLTMKQRHDMLEDLMLSNLVYGSDQDRLDKGRGRPSTRYYPKVREFRP